jgi:diadenosine tetraphosphate (Ap4A) HIT family hydrolase
MEVPEAVTKQQNCLFCSLVAGDTAASIAFDDERVMAVMTIRPKHVGHVLLFPKEHVEDFSLLDHSAPGHLFHVAARLKAAVCEVVPCEGFQLLLNQREATGQKSDCRHLHLHLLPRSLGIAVDLDGRAAEVPRKELDETARELIRRFNIAAP